MTLFVFPPSSYFVILTKTHQPVILTGKRKFNQKSSGISRIVFSFGYVRVTQINQTSD